MHQALCPLCIWVAGTLRKDGSVWAVGRRSFQGTWSSSPSQAVHEWQFRSSPRSRPSQPDREACKGERAPAPSEKEQGVPRLARYALSVLTVKSQLKEEVNLKQMAGRLRAAAPARSKQIRPAPSCLETRQRKTESGERAGAQAHAGAAACWLTEKAAAGGRR